MQTHIKSNKYSSLRKKEMLHDFLEQSSSIKDPSIDRNKLHLSSSIIFLNMCGVLIGCNDLDEIERYSIEKEYWLKKFIESPHGVPPHDTINRVFACLKPQRTSKLFSTIGSNVL